MLEAFSYRHYKKKQLEKQLREGRGQSENETLSKEDEEFIRRALDKQTENLVKPVMKFLHIRKSSEASPKPTPEEVAAVNSKQDGAATPKDEEEDLSGVLSALNMAVEKKTAFSFSEETRDLLKQFTQILKDIQSGAPHAYDDLHKFLKNNYAKLDGIFNTIPDFLKSLIAALPFPFAKKFDTVQAASTGKGKAPKKDVSAEILKDLTKPGVITSLLRNIMNTLKTRFPAFGASNALLSLGVFVLLFSVYYCYKRGREERLKAEAASEVPVVLVEGAKPEDDSDHGLGKDKLAIKKETTAGTSESAVVAGNVVSPQPLHSPPISEAVAEARDAQVEKPTESPTPLQVESDRVPSPQKKRRSLFGRSNS